MLKEKNLKNFVTIFLLFKEKTSELRDATDSIPSRTELCVKFKDIILLIQIILIHIILLIQICFRLRLTENGKKNVATYLITY